MAKVSHWEMDQCKDEKQVKVCLYPELQMAFATPKHRVEAVNKVDLI